MAGLLEDWRISMAASRESQMHFNLFLSISLWRLTGSYE
jgi:hypothetical protein